MKNIPLWAKIAGGALLTAGIGYGLYQMAKPDDPNEPKPETGTDTENKSYSGQVTTPKETAGSAPTPPNITSLKDQEVYVADRPLKQYQGTWVWYDNPVDGQKMLAYRGEPLGKATGVIQRYNFTKADGTNADLWFIETDGKGGRNSIWARPLWVALENVTTDNNNSPYAHFIQLYYGLNVGAAMPSNDDEVIAYAKNICADEISFLHLIYNNRVRKDYKSFKDLMVERTLSPLNEEQYKQFIANLKKC